LSVLNSPDMELFLEFRIFQLSNIQTIESK